MAGKLSDGTAGWFGGMDLSRSAYEIDPSQYAKGINVAITKVGDSLRPRPGWHWQTIKFSSPLEQTRFEEGHVQGGAWYFDGATDCLVISVSGVIFFIKQERPGYWRAKTLNLGNPANPNRPKVWTCRIPGNRLIMCDGQSRPYVLGLDGDVYRPTGNLEIGPCKMMAYIQNRVWYVNPEGTAVFFTNQNDPLSVTDAIDANIFGFTPPDDRERITAIGTQRYMNFDQNGGELVFSTENNVYAVNVVANVPPSQWGYQSNIGVIRLVLSGIGATSGYSFTSYNSNLFFRSQSLGVVNYKQLQSQFSNNAEMISSSIEVDYWFNNDTPWLLDQCWTVNYNGRLLTTTQPFLKDGFCAWNGIISMNPAPIYEGRVMPRRFEGLWTGVRPWCLLVKEGQVQQLFTVSADKDGKNRLYMMVDKEPFDIGPDNKVKPIQTVIETRAYSFKNPYDMKVVKSRFYTLDEITSDVQVKASSRSTLKGPWYNFFETTHYIEKCVRTENCWPFNTAIPEQRPDFFLPDEKEGLCARPGGSGRRTNIPYRQYRLEYTGQYELALFGLTADWTPEDMSIGCKEKPDRYAGDPLCKPKDFSYSIVDSNPVINDARRKLPSSNPSKSQCGC